MVGVSIFYCIYFVLFPVSVSVYTICVSNRVEVSFHGGEYIFVLYQIRLYACKLDFKRVEHSFIELNLFNK